MEEQKLCLALTSAGLLMVWGIRINVWDGWRIAQPVQKVFGDCPMWRERCRKI
jgi:hypothetical protein